MSSGRKLKAWTKPGRLPGSGKHLDAALIEKREDLAFHQQQTQSRRSTPYAAEQIVHRQNINTQRAVQSAVSTTQTPSLSNRANRALCNGQAMPDDMSWSLSSTLAKAFLKREAEFKARKK